MSFLTLRGESCAMWLVLLLSLIVYEESSAQLSKNRDELLNWCLDATYHKKEPGPEAKLFDQCTPWKDRSCCTENTTRDIHEKSLYNFNFNHCREETGHGMSEACLRHFRQDHCFYECEPNIGPWVQKDSKKMRKERFLNVPLCSSDCDSWWEACKDDLTCTDNWPVNMKFNSSGNHCPKGAKCQTFEKIYKTAKDFCEKVWNYSWKYTENGACMRIWFNGSAGNPNRRVAEVYVDQLLNSSSYPTKSLLLVIFLLFVLTI